MERIIFTALFSCCLSGLMSGWVTFINLGITDTFLSDWSMAFIKAYPMAFDGRDLDWLVFSGGFWMCS